MILGERYLLEVDLADARLFLRVSYETRNARREKLFGYHTAGGSSSLSFAPPSNDPPLPSYPFPLRTINPHVQSLITVQFSPDGSLWQDPPRYWDDIVWPADIKAHKNIFFGGNVSYGDAIVIGEGHGVELPVVEQFSVLIKGTRSEKGDHDSC